MGVLQSFLTKWRASALGYSQVGDQPQDDFENPYSDSLTMVLRLATVVSVVFGVIIFGAPTRLFSTTFSSSTSLDSPAFDLLGQPFNNVPINPYAMVDATMAEHAEGARRRNKICHGIDWQQACQRVPTAGARRRLLKQEKDNEDKSNQKYSQMENHLLDSDDPSVTYDENCLRVYRLDLFGNATFPYHASNLLRAGGNHTMALFIQHGAVRDADAYFCSFRQLMLKQKYRPFDDIMVIAPDFNYKTDPGVLPTDAFWNSTKPWGDWRVGAESDPECCGNGFGTHGGPTISSFHVLDHMLKILTDKAIYPNLNKISYVGHSAGGQMVQRYAIASQLAAYWDYDPSVAVEFLVANPSSYAYLDDRRWKYSCGDCSCNSDNCTCTGSCYDLDKATLGTPSPNGVGKEWVCFDPKYNHWPYGITQLQDSKHAIPYALQAAGAYREGSIVAFRDRSVVYFVGQNDTCNDGLATCSSDCWKRDNYLPGVEWPCFRNHMDTRCPAMLEGPNRRTRGLQYMKWLESFYGKPTHRIHVIPGVGHDATGIYGSSVGLEELFD